MVNTKSNDAHRNCCRVILKDLFTFEEGLLTQECDSAVPITTADKEIDVIDKEFKPVSDLDTETAEDCELRKPRQVCFIVDH